MMSFGHASMVPTLTLTFHHRTCGPMTRFSLESMHSKLRYVLGSARTRYDQAVGAVLLHRHATLHRCCTATLHVAHAGRLTARPARAARTTACASVTGGPTRAAAAGNAVHRCNTVVHHATLLCIDAAMLCTDVVPRSSARGCDAGADLHHHVARRRGWRY
jgi:hypothetical protein